MEASAGLEPAVEVLQVGLNGPPTSARGRAVFGSPMIVHRGPPRTYSTRGRCRHHCRQPRLDVGVHLDNGQVIEQRDEVTAWTDEPDGAWPRETADRPHLIRPEL